MKKNIILLFILFIFTTPAQATQTIVSINDVSVEPGNDICATIMLNDVINYGTGTIKVTYNPDIAQVTGVKGTTDSSVLAWNADNSAGSITISGLNPNGKTGDVEFTDVKFHAIGNSGSSEPLTLDVTTLQDTSDNEIPTTFDHSSLSITDSSESVNGYLGDKPLTIFSHETITGNLTYSIGSSDYSGKLYPDNPYQVEHNISIPIGATVKFARLYAYWTWSVGSTDGYPDLKLTFDNDVLSPAATYDDRKGFGNYDFPSGTWAYNVTNYVTGSGDHTTVIENTGPDNSYFLMDGVGMLVVYTESDGDEIEYWIAEGCDLISSQPVSGLTPEEATTQAVFSGTINLTNIKEATLTTVVQSGNDIDNMLIFNLENWTGIYNGTPYANLDVDKRSVLNYLVDNNNTARIRAVDDYMVPSNAFLVLWHTSPEHTQTPGDKIAVSLTADIKPEISIEITPYDLNFGSLVPGEISSTHQILIKNNGSTNLSVTAEVTDTAQDLYVRGVQINNAIWTGYQVQLTSNGTEEADLRLRVPVDYSGEGEKEGVLMFWAQQV
ncbi:MAG: DUF3344 domain-containing protein [Methanosarcinales archaeon]|nr:DUF3344 domain-containing protein [Methanosarcinales archaeon]